MRLEASPRWPSLRRDPHVGGSFSRSLPLNTLTVGEDVTAAGAGAMAAPADPRLKEETCFRNGSGAPPWWAP